MPRKLKIKSPHLLLKEQCDRLWIECVKIRAGYKSEISGKGKHSGHTIGSHHFDGKECYALRYALENGICLENNGEHLFGVHNHNPKIARQFQERAKERLLTREGQGIFEKLDQLSHVKNVDLNMVKIYLQQEKKRLLYEYNKKNNFIISS